LITPSTKADYLFGVDGLRAIAVSLVLMFHAVPAAIPGGFIGVDVFFVISGFLITRLILTELESTGRVSLSSFYLRRARRLLPALAVVCVATFGLATVVLLPDDLLSFGNSLLATATFASNFYFNETTDYFSDPAHAKPLLHTWSLAVEEQFYLVWPILLALWWRYLPKKSLLIAIAVIGLASFIHSDYTTRTDERFAFFMTSSRAWELLVGAALATLVKSPSRVGRAVIEASGALGLAAIAASALWLSDQSRFPGQNALLTCFGAAGVILACHCRSLTATLLSAPPLRYLGRISYGVYLWHWPLLALAHYHWERTATPREAMVILALAVALAALTWHWIEQPLRYGRSASIEGAVGPRRLLPYAALLSVLAAAGWGVALLEGLPSRLDAPAARIWQDLTSENPSRQSCDGTENINRNHDVCNLGVAMGTPAQFDVLLIGDSNAEHLAELVSLYAKANGYSARQATRNSCSALLGQDRPSGSPNNLDRCREFQRQILRLIDLQQNLKHVFISHAWHRFDAASSDNGIGGRGNHSRAAADLSYFLEKTIRWLEHRGVAVTLVGPIPLPPELLIKCVISQIRAGRDTDPCAIPRETLAIDPRVAEKTLKAVSLAHPRVTLFLPTDAMCDEFKCQMAMDGVLLYRDVAHLNRHGAEVLYRRMIERKNGM